MNHTARKNAISAPLRRITRMWVLCGLVGAASMGAASAATVDDDVPRIVIHYYQDSLTTDSGARALYHRLVNAAEQVCPGAPIGSRLISNAARECREQSIARAVREINSPRLAALHANVSKNS
jgi:UrcA family protein